MPKLWEALLTLAILIAALAVGIIIFGVDPHVPMFVGVMAGAIMALHLGYKWDEVEKSMMDGIYKALQSICILIIVGILIGVWINAGVVPTMIYYGLKVLKPAIFFIACVLICSITSLATGTSWGTMGTMGVALMGIGFGLGMSPGMTAGAVLSGAYFGDKMSPLSDTTNLAPAMAGTTVFTHVKHMVVTAGPSIIISLIIYAIMGFTVVKGTASMETIDLYMGTLKEFFTISPVMLIPPLCVLLMVIFKVPAIPGLIGVSALGGIFAAIFQKANLATILASMYTGVSMDTGVAEINRLVNRGGLSSMLDTVALILIALAFAGVVETTGAVHAIIEKILSKAKSDKAMMTTAIFATLFTNFATAAQYVAIVLPGRMFREAFRERGLHPKNLSRILEDVGTICAPFCPWSTDGVYILATLGCATAAYAPYMFFSMLCPIVSLICIWTGWTITRITPEQAKEDIIP